MSRIGANPTLRTTTADFELLDVHCDEDGREWWYVQANGAIDQYDAVILDESGQAVVFSNTNSASAFGQKAGIASAAFADNEYGWICRGGTGTDIKVNVLASAAANAQLNGTATDGALDDDATAGSEDMTGIVIITADGGSGSAIQCILTRPTVGATN